MTLVVASGARRRQQVSFRYGTERPGRETSPAATPTCRRAVQARERVPRVSASRDDPACRRWCSNRRRSTSAVGTERVGPGTSQQEVNPVRVHRHSSTDFLDRSSPFLIPPNRTNGVATDASRGADQKRHPTMGAAQRYRLAEVNFWGQSRPTELAADIHIPGA
jgi:hypothetical protein